MRFLIAILLPPLAVLLCGRPFQALLSIPLTICFWIPGMVHALFVVNAYYEDRRTDRVVRAIERGRFAFAR